MKKSISSLLAMFVLMGALAGCSQNNSVSSGVSSEVSSSNSAQGTAYPLTVSNYSVEEDGAVWAEKNQVFESAPQRIVANMQGSAELLIRLGLGDRIVGVAAIFGEVDPTLKEEFEKIPVLAEGYAGQEVILGANPDIVIGSGHFFIEADWGSGTVDFLNAADIHTYIMNISKDGAASDDFFRDIDELGRIFDVQEAAEALKAQYQKQIDEMINNPVWSGKEKKLAVISSVEDGNFGVSSGKGLTFQNDAYELIGLNNIFKDAPGDEVSNEDLIESNPDVLVLFWYKGGPDTDAQIEELCRIEALQDVTAIKERQIYVVDCNAFYGCGGGIFDEVSKLAEKVWAQ